MSPTFYYYSVFRTNSDNSVFYYMNIQIEISDDFEHNVQNLKTLVIELSNSYTV